MADRNGHGLIDIKVEESGLRGSLIIVGGLDIGRALQAGGDGRQGIGAVDIDRATDLKAGWWGRHRFARWPRSDSKS